MSKGKTWQRVASAFLAAVMTFSTFSTTIAYAAEATTDSSITTDAVSDTDAAEEVDATNTAASSSTTEGEVTKPEATEAPAATETPDETDATEPEETPAPTEAPTPTPEPTESPEATAEPEPTEEPEETETPNVSESDFVAVGLADDATEGQIDAEIGDEVTFNAHVNRDDVNLQYQWYKRFIEPQTTEYDEDLMEYDYGGDEPTAYGFLVEGKTPAEVLAENPDAGWSGIELYRAVVSAMEAIGADTSNVNIEFGTRNYALEGFTITATMVDGNVVISADKDNEHATGTLNENNEFAFAESTNNDIAVQPAEVQTEEEVDPDSLEANGWEAIEGATSDTYTHTVDEYDAYTTYRCVITIADDDYIAAAKKALVALGADESKLTDDALDNTFMSEITIHIPSMDASEDDIYNDLSVEDKLKQRLALSGIATYAAGVQLDSQSNPQWVTGLSAGMEYLTADMYAKLYGQDGKGGWLAEGKVTPEQADRYWSKITSSGFSTYAVANELDSEGLPTGATRQYSSFTLTDGKLEINSEWYGKTVYFRYYNPNIVGNTATGTAVSIPAAGRGTSYKDAVQVLFCYVVEENGITLPLTIKEYVTQATHNGYSANGLAHITLNTISANKFNVDPDRYLKDAEGNYRNDSVYWGTCYYSEPDLSGKAYYALKNFIGNGYGFGIGHDTMYAYAGAYFDAYGGGSGYPNVKYTEKNIDPNDTATRYYSVNSYKVNTGHWNMNALMGENNSNTLVGSGYYSASDEEYFGWIVDPMTVPSAIMSSGGSHGPFAKSTIYGGRRLYIRTNGGYTYEQAMANADIKHRTPTNWPYKFNQGDTIPAALTHSNGQVAFDDIWVQYNGCASDFTDAGLGKLYEPTVDGRQGTNNFYLAGSGNFVMNQIGHLPIDNGNGSWNNASTEEMQLCVNTLMWISQRKQCEVCAADQGDQRMTHFVHRVNTANAKKILTALANGGSYWYSLNDCYELMEDLNLQKLGFNSANWKPIKNFTGHWNSKYFDVKVPRDAALFDNTTGTLGAYRTGDGNDWNLGTNKKNGWDTVFKDSGSSAPSVRTTGIARIYGKLGDAKLFNDGQIHEGYTVHIRYEDNLELLQEGDDFSCVVNNVDQYCISNLPCIYQGGSTIMRARVYDKNGNEVTKYGPIVAKVPPHFWNDCETVPLELLKVEATPIENYQYWEGETSKVLKGSGIIYNQPISDSAVTWYYRIVDLRNTSDVVADWTKITNKTFTTSDGSVSGVIGTPIFHDGNDGINNYPHSSVDVQLSMLAYTGHAIQLRTDYLIEGKVYSTIDPGVITPEASGIIQIEERPMSMTQSPNQRVMTQDQAIFTFESDYWKGLGDKGYNVKVQYIGPYDDDWQDVETSTTFGGTYTLNTVDGSQHAKIKVESSTVDTLKEGAKTESKIHDNKWLPGTFWRPDGFTDQQCAQKHTTVKLTLYAADYNWAGYKFRIVASYRFNDKRTKVETSDSANGDEDNAKYDQSRYGLLTVDAPYISATTMKAQALMMQKHNDENDASGTFGQNYWSEEETDQSVVDGWNSSRGDWNNPLIADNNVAVYTTTITFAPGKLTESGDRLLTPVLQWGFQDDLTSTSTEYKPIIGAININGYANNGVGLTTSNYKDFKNIVKTHYDIDTDANSQMKQVVDKIETEHNNIGPFGKFKAYITIDDIKPVEDTMLNSKPFDINSPYAKWTITTSLHIESATNPMDFGTEHFYFQCRPYLEYIRGYNSTNLKSQTITYTKAHNFDYVNGGYDMEHTDTGAELWLDYNISIHANERNLVACGADQHSIFMYPDLTIEAPNGLRYIMTRYQIVKEFPYGITRETSRTTYSSSDKPEIDTSVRYQGAMQKATSIDMKTNQRETIDVQGKTMAELGIEVDGRGWLKDTDENYAPYLKNGYALHSDYSYPKEIWQWFWRNAVKYHCYDREEYDGTNEQVFFYIDEKNVRRADQDFGANDGSNGNQYSSWTAPFDATYQIDLWGAGGGGLSQDFGKDRPSSPAESGGHVTITADIKEGTTLYFVAGGAGNRGGGVAVDWKDPGNASGGNGGYNGGGSGGSSGRKYDCVAYDKDDEGHGTPDTTYHSMDPVGYGGGGGATTVATRLAGVDGQLKNYAGDTSALIGVAGGGSGATGGSRDTNGYAGFAIGGSGGSHDGDDWIFHCAQTKTMTIQCDWGPETYEHGDVCAANGVDSGKFAGHNELANVEDEAKLDDTRHEGGGGAGYKAASKSGAARGTSYVSETTTLENGNIIIKSSSTDNNGSDAGKAGRAKIKVVNLDQRLYRRVGKNAMDIGFQDSNECHPTNVKVKLTVANKMYDGTPVVVAKSIVWDETDAGIPESILDDIDIVYSNNESANITKPTNASTDSKKKPLVRTGSYTATAIYRGTKYNVTFCWENTLPGKTYVVRGESTTPDQYMSGEGNVVYFDIYPRPLYLYSYNNDKIYDNISTAKVKDIKIEGPTQNSGIVNGDAVDLNTRLAYGYYCDAYAPEDYATASFREQLHTGLHSIKTVTILELVNNPFDNYYIAKEDFTGTINPRPLYVHSQYHDTNKYKWNYDGNSNDIGNNKYLTDTVPYDGQNMTVEQAYEAILAGKRENIDITRYTKTEQDNYQNTVVNPNNIKVYDSYYNAAIGEEGQGNIYIDNITNYDAVALNAQTYVGSYADSNAGEQLTGYDSNGDNGVIKADRYNGLSTNTIRHLPYSVKYSYSTPNPQVGQKMTVTIAVTNKDQGYGLAAQNNYVAPVAIQNLRLKSRFAGNGPITLKSTNGIRMNQNGTEFYIDTIPVGGTVNIVFEYTVQDIDDLNALVRTIEQNNEMYLVNNNYNDYYIADKTFSGGIYRTTLRAQVKSESTTYGFGFKGKLPYADDVYYWNKGSDSWLTMEGLVEDHKTAAQDDEKLDLKAKNTNQYKSEFVYKLVPSETTDAGSYPVKYIGLNEFNYDLLKNYVVTEDPGSIEVRPRKIMVSVDESQKIYGTTNPFFNSTFKVLGTDAQGNELDMTDENNWTVLGDDSTVDYNNMKLIGGDTVGNVVEVINGAARSPLAFTNGVSNLPYLTTATQNSDVIYQTDVPAEDCAYCLEKYNEMHKGHEHYHDDDHPHSHVPVNGYPVSVNENAGYGSTLGIKTVTNSEGQTVSNYELVYESNVLKIHPRLIRIAAIDATKAYGGTEPALKWVVDGEIIKPTSEMLGIKAVRDSGENVRDAGYTIRISYEKSTANNYIVETNNATMTITPVPLTIVFGNQERYYGEENPNDYRLDVIGLKHGDTVDTALKNNDGATAKVLETAKKTLSDYIDLTYNKFTDVGSNYLYGDKSYCEEHTILVPRENADGGYNYTVASYTPGVLTIKPRPMLLTVTGWQKELGDKDKVQDFTLTDMITHNSISGQQKLGAGSRITDASVVVNPDKVPIVFNLVRAEGEEVGSYPVYSTPQDRQIGNLAANDQKQLELDNPNYDFEYRYANDLIVKRQGLMITVDDKVRYYGDRVNRFYDGSTDYTYHVFKVENGTAVEITAEEAGINTNSFTFTHLDTQTSSSGTYKGCISLSGVHSTIYDDDDITITAGNLTIIPRPVSVVAEDNTKVYGDADPELKYTLHDGVRGDDGNYYIEYANGPVLTEKEGADVPVQPGDLEGTGVTREPGEDVWTGEHSFGKAYAINANDISPVSKDGVTNYIITMENGNFTITPAELVVTVKGGYSKTYGEENPAFDADITGFKRDDTQETVLNGELGFATLCYDLSDAGKYIVTAGNNNEDTVNPDCVVLEDGEKHIGSTFEVKTNTNFEKNYVIRYVNGDITVNPKELIVRIDHKVKTYGTADPAFTYRYEDNAGNVIGLIDPENSPLSLELYRTKGENVVRGDVTAADSLDKWGTTLFDGDYLISAKYDVNNKNYNVTVIDGSLKIVPATLTVKVNGGYRTTYGDEIPNFTYSITGFVGRDVKDETGTGIKDDESKVSGSATLYCNDTAGNPVSNKTKVGNYPINYDKQQLVADNSNYKFIYVGGDLTIGKKPIHVKADDQQKPYGEKDPDPLTWTITDPEELVNPGDEDFFDITTKRPGADTDDGEQVGKYPITIDGTDPSGNYEIITTPGTLTIVPATIIITVIDDEKYFGEDNPTPNVTITGFKRGDTIDDIGGKDALKTKTDAEKWSPVGEYPVSAKDSTFHNPNYDFVYIDGKLTVKPLIINIKAEDDRKTYGDNDPDKFEVSYTLTNEKDEEYQPSKDLRDYIDRALNLDGTRIPGENVRTENPGYPIIPSYTEVPNIEIGTVTPGRFFIDPRVVTITANSAEKVYDGTPLTESGYTYAPELVDNEKLGIHDKMDSVTVIGSQTEVGSSPNVPSDAVIVNTMDGTSSNTNYTIKYVNGTLTVRDKEGVSIKKTADRERTTDYEVIRYTITVTNATSHDLHNVVVKDTNNFVGTPVLSQANGVTYDADNGEFIIDEISHLRDATHTNVVTFSYTYTVDPTDHGTDNNDILENNAKITDMKVVESYTENPDGTQTPNYTEPDKDWLVKTPDVDVEIIRQDLTIEKSADKTEAAVGDIVTYQLKVTNTGNSTLENVVVKDQNNFMGAPVENTQVHFGYRVNDDGTWTITSLGAGKTVTITYKYTVVAEDLANGKLDNIATATIPAREDPTIPEKPIDSNEVIVPLYYKHLTIVKSADRDHAYPGEVVKYQVTVTNDGTVDMTNVTVSDNTNALGMFIIASGDGYSYNPETKLFTIPVLNVGDSVTLNYLYIVQNGDPDTIINVATAHSPKNPDTEIPGDKDITEPSDPVKVDVLRDGLNIEKKADKSFVDLNGDDATVTYTLTVKNSGNTKLTNVIVTDTSNGNGTVEYTGDLMYDGNGKWMIAELNAGESVEITYVYTAVAEDIDLEGSNIVNTAVAEGKNPDGKTVTSDPDTETVHVGEIPERGEVKVIKTSRESSAMVGDTIHYTISATNTGKLAVTNIVVRDFNDGVGEINAVSSDKYTYDAAAHSFTIAEIAAGETVEIPVTYTVQEGDKGTVNNAAVEIPDVPEIKKEADKQVVKVGEVVTYTITVTNTTNETKTNVEVKDTNNFTGVITPAENTNVVSYVGDKVWNISSIGAGESVDIVYTYTVMSEDAPNDMLVNTAEMTYVTDSGKVTIPSNEVDVPIIPEEPTPERVGPTVVKQADKSIANIGDTVHYTVTLHNNDTVDYVDAALHDQNNFSGVITNVKNGTLESVSAGSAVIKVGTIPAGKTVTVEYDYIVLNTDAGKGQDTYNELKNVATLHYWFADEDKTSENEKTKPSNEVIVKVPGNDVPVPVNPPEGKLKVEKFVDKKSASVGDMLNYTVKVSNVGDGELKNVLIEDFFDGHGKLNYIPTVGVVVNGDGTYTINKLPAGTFMELRFTYVIVEGDEPEVLNAAVVTTPPVDPPLEPTKTADKKFAFVDEIVTYTISVYNPDTKAKTNVTVKDTNNFVGSINAANTDKYTYNGDNTWTIPEIGAGETIDITYTYTVQSNDEKLLENKADVMYSENGDTVKLDTPTVDVVVPDKGTVSIHKEADKKMAKPGEVVTYNVTVTNNKGFDVHDVVVTDANNFAGEITGVDGADYTFENGEFHIAEIAAGASVTLTYTYTVEIGDVPTQILENIATADVPGTNPEDPNNPGHGKDPNKPIDNDEKIPSNPVDVEVPGSETETKIPDLVLTKSVDKSEAAVGDTLNYTITVKNNGKGDAENVMVKDFFDGKGTLNFVAMDGVTDNGDDTYTIASVKAGESVTLNFTYVVVDGDAPEVLNAAVITTPEPPAEIVKSADKHIAKVNEIVTYTITVKNNSKDTLTNLLVSDTNNFKGKIEAKDGKGYTYNGDKTWTIATLESGKSIDITYTYTMQANDASVIENTADVRYSHNGSDYDIPSNPVDVEKPDDGVVTIFKTADKTKAEPNEVVTYTVTIHNGKDYDIKNVRLTDANNFAGKIEGVDGAGYKFINGEFVIDKIPAGGDAVVHYTYTVQIADVPTKILENVATAHVPGKNPGDPDEEIPSNKVDVEVPGDGTHVDVPEGKLEIVKSVDKTEAKVGDTLNYTITLTNVGGQAVKNAVVKDFFDGNGVLNFVPMDGVTDNGDYTYTVANVEKGQSITLRFTYTVVAGDAPMVLNAAVVKDPTPPVDIEKTADKHVAMVDEVVNYTITVKNTTDKAVTDLLVSDTNNFTGAITSKGNAKYTYNGNHTWTIPSIKAGESIDILYTYTVKTTDPSTLVNEADVRYTTDDGEYVIKADPVEVVVPKDGEVTIVKSGDKKIAEPGEVVTYTVTIHNGKAHDITNVVVSDSNNFAGTITGSNGVGYKFVDGHFVIDKIAAGADAVLTYTYTVQVADVPTHILENVATAHVPGTNPEDPENPGHGKDPDKPIDPDTDIPSNKVDVEVPGSEVDTKIPEFSVTKTVDKAQAKVGDTLNYSVTVKNSGAADAENVVVKDFFDGNGVLNFKAMDGVTDNGDNSYTIAAVKAGESVTLNFSYVVVEGDAPQVLNAAIIKDKTPPIDIVKGADKHIAMVDEIVTYTISVKNTTSETVENVEVVDTNNFKGSIEAASAENYTYNGDKTWTIPTIAAGETINITYTYTMQAEDATVIENVAKVIYSKDGTDYNIPSNPVDVEKPDDGVVTIRKAADKTKAEPGEVVTYTVTVHNGKNHDIENARLTDTNNFAGEIVGVDGADYTFENGVFTISKIPAGGDVVVHYTYTVEVADVPTHILENIATIFVPGTNPEDPDNPGHGKDPEKPLDPDTEIPSNKVDVEVPNGSEVDTDIPKLSVTKSVDKPTAKVGDTLTYTVTVQNSGKADAQNVVMKDFFDGNGVLNFETMAGVTDNGNNTYTISTVKAGESVTLRFTYVVVDGDAPVVLNAAIVKDPTPPIDVEKDADKYIAKVTDVVTYTITVKNTTGEAVNDITVTDHNNFAGAITAESTERCTYNGDGTWTIGHLDAGETLDIVYTYTVETTDKSVMENTATIKYTHDGEQYEIPSNTVDVEKPDDGVVTIRKAANKTEVEPGETVTYTVTVHNGKNHDIENARLTDANNFAGEIVGIDGAGYTFKDGEFIIDKIAAGADVVIHYNYTAQIADVPTEILENIATIHVPGTNPEDPENPGHGKDPNKPIDPDEDVPSNKVDVKVPGSEVETKVPVIEITKSVDKAEAKVGDTLNYTVTVSNKGKADAENVVIEDFFDGTGTLNFIPMDGVKDNGDNTYTISSVKVGESIELHFTYVVTVSDAPQVLNAAVVKDPTPPIDVEKDADKYVAKVTDVVTYTITVRNTTDETVNDITVSDHNNFSGSIDAVGSDRYTYNGDGTWTIGYLDADEAIDIVYTYTVETTDKSVMENTATIKYTHDGEQYNIPSNTVDVKKPDDGVVTIWKSANKTVAKPGETVTYTVTVHNGKDHDIQNAVLTDENNFSGSIFAVEGAGYHYENGMFTIDTIPAGGDVVVHYAYTVGIADVPTNILENIATIHVPGTNPEDPENPGQGKDPTKPIDPDTDIPSNKVDVEVPGSGTETDIPLEKSLTIVKSADKTKVNVGETINYRVVVTNTGEVDLVNVSVKDNNNGASHIVATSGDGYTYDDATATFTIDRIPVGESFTLTYSYVAVDADAGHDVINVAVAKAPGQNPEDPENPGHGKDPSKPIDEDVEKPSNEVKVPVVKPSTPVTPDEPKPTPTPSNPTNPTPTPVPSEKPTNPIQGIVSIITGNKKTGIGFVQGIAGLAAVVGVGLIALVVVNHKRKKDTDNDEDKHNNESAE